MGKGGRRRRQERWIIIPLYGPMRLCVPTYLIKLACRSSAVVNGAVGLPTSVLMRIPLKGHTISASTRHAKETASLNVLRWNSKNTPYRRLGRSIMTYCGIRQQIRFVFALFSIWQYVEICFAEPDTIFWCSLSS